MDVRTAIRQIITRYKSPRYRGKTGVFDRFEARTMGGNLDVIVDVLPSLLNLSPEREKQLAAISRALTRLDHPRVARVLEVAQREGVPYIVRAAGQGGGTLLARLKAEPMDLEKAGALISQIGSAIEYAAQQDVVHGALSPDQIMVDESGDPHVSGFGMALMAAFAGVPFADPNNPYLAPEVRVEHQTPSTRSDVYSLAAILYRVMTGQAPDVDPQRIVSPDRLNPAIPPMVASLVMRSLSPRPADRSYSAGDFVLAARSAIRSPQSMAPETHVAPAAEEPVGAQLPAPLPFPEPMPIVQPDMSPLTEAARIAAEMLESATQAIQMPEPLPMPIPDVPAGHDENIEWTPTRRANDSKGS
jgi:serine/threonine protein kinase